MNHEEHDDLWELLGRARQTKASPFFSRNVLREVRNLGQERRSGWSMLFFRWQPLTAAICVACILAGGFFMKHRQQEDEQRQILAIAEDVYASPDYSVINELDVLLESEKNSAWLSSDVN